MRTSSERAFLRLPALERATAARGGRRGRSRRGRRSGGRGRSGSRSGRRGRSGGRRGSRSRLGADPVRRRCHVRLLGRAGYLEVTLHDPGRRRGGKKEEDVLGRTTPDGLRHFSPLAVLQDESCQYERSGRRVPLRRGKRRVARHLLAGRRCCQVESHLDDGVRPYRRSRCGSGSLRRLCRCRRGRGGGSGRRGTRRRGTRRHEAASRRRGRCWGGRGDAGRRCPRSRCQSTVADQRKPRRRHRGARRQSNAQACARHPQGKAGHGCSFLYRTVLSHFATWV